MQTQTFIKEARNLVERINLTSTTATEETRVEVQHEINRLFGALGNFYTHSANDLADTALANGYQLAQTVRDRLNKAASDMQREGYGVW